VNLTEILQITKIGVNATIIAKYKEAEMASLPGWRGRFGLVHRESDVEFSEGVPDRQLPDWPPSVDPYGRGFV
jgi:hypothetical protein